MMSCSGLLQAVVDNQSNLKLTELLRCGRIKMFQEICLSLYVGQDKQSLNDFQVAS